MLPTSLLLLARAYLRGRRFPERSLSSRRFLTYKAYVYIRHYILPAIGGSRGPSCLQTLCLTGNLSNVTVYVITSNNKKPYNQYKLVHYYTKVTHTHTSRVHRNTFPRDMLHNNKSLHLIYCMHCYCVRTLTTSVGI